jgi:hypothetical protein
MVAERGEFADAPPHPRADDRQAGRHSSGDLAPFDRDCRGTDGQRDDRARGYVATLDHFGS